MLSPLGTRARRRVGTKPARRRRWRALAALVAVLALCGAAIHWGPYPWAFPLLPTLTGSWNGELRLAAHDRRYVHLKLGLDTSKSNCRGDCAINGDALICDSRGAVQEYLVGGDPHNWRGTRFYLDLYAHEPRPGQLLDLGRIEGQWHGDVLQLHARPSFDTVGQDGSITSFSGPAQPLLRSWKMRRGDRTEFASGCSRLR